MIDMFKIIPAMTNKKYIEGEKFYLSGVEYPLAIKDSTSGNPLEFSDGQFALRADARKNACNLFNCWYGHALWNKLHETLPVWCKKVMVNPRAVHIKTVKTLWGSCSSRLNLTFCTRLALVPPELLDYVIVHELCHIKEMNHSPRFWTEVAKYIPDCKERRNILRTDGYLYKWW